MKCQYCGANLQIEDAFCPHCGKENPHYIRHRSDMAAYQADYESTKEEVLENTRKLSRKTIRIAVIAILVALCAAAGLFCFLADDIRYARQEKEIEKNRVVYEEKIRAYMEEVDPVDLAVYGRRNGLSYADAISDYYKVFSVSSDYNYFYSYTMELVAEGTEGKYYTLEEKCSDIARCFRRIYEDSEQKSYDKEIYYSEGKAKYMAAVAKKAETVLKAYFGLTDEEALELPVLSEARLTILLEERYQDAQK